jgi:hypothetical protein
MVKSRKKKSSKNFGHTEDFMMLPMKNNHPIGEKSPYLATLDENQMQAL